MLPSFAILLFWLVWGLIWLGLTLLWNQPIHKRANLWQDAGLRIATFIGFVLLLRLVTTGFEVRHHFWNPLRGAAGWTLLVVVFAAFVASLWARLQMGALWSGSIASKERHRLVSEGPYSLVRHPSYVASFIAVLATAIGDGAEMSFFGAAILTACWCYKARLEEQFLREELGRDAYDSYAARVPMFVPSRRWPMEALLRYFQHV